MNDSIQSLLPASLAFQADNFDFNALPAGAGVFLLETAGEPFLGKSGALRRRLQRLLGPVEEGKQGRGRKRLNLRATTAAIRYRATGSAFETSVALYQAARAAFPDRYRELLRLRPPPLLKVNLANAYPRCYVTRRLGRGPALYYGPFPARAAAEKFASEFLDLFLVRRCTFQIQPDPAHPGCIYGEMSMCLRPCQAACTREQYLEEAGRLTAFLSTGGASLVKSIEAERNRASEELDFEAAARLHKRLERVHQALQQRPELAVDLERLHGLVIQPAAQAPTEERGRPRPPAPDPSARASGRQAEDGRAPTSCVSAGPRSPGVELFPVWRGFLLPQVTFTFEVVEGKPVSLDARLRQALSALPTASGQLPVASGQVASLDSSARTRAEHLALLARWFYRGTRAGEFVPFDSFQQLPFRKIVGAISRVARAAAAQPDPPG